MCTSEILKKLVIIIATLLISAAIVSASTIQLPQTGQTKCYDLAGTEIACAGTGQDGDIRAGVAWPNPRFTDNGDGTITDNLTGLIWTKNADLPSSTKTWQEALDYVASLNNSNYLGFNDWCLPNANELRSLINTESGNSTAWLNGNGFTSVHASNYWSSSTNKNSIGSAWAVSIWRGFVDPWDKVNNHFYVWPMRGGQSGIIQLPKTGQTTSYAAGDDGDLERGIAWPNPRFAENWLGTITDNLTGLMWAKNGDIPNGKKTWQEALDYVASLNNSNYLGFNDWYFPNVNEMKSLINLSVRYTSQWLWGQGFDYSVRSGDYWSSSTYAGNKSYAWYVDMWHGNVGSGNKGSTSGYVWPVRTDETGEFNNLIVSKSGNGNGTVTSTPARIECGQTCSASFLATQTVTLAAASNGNSIFTGWSGDCTDTGDCTVTMDTSKSVTAEFTALSTTTTTGTSTTTTTITTITTTTTTTSTTTTTLIMIDGTITLLPVSVGTEIYSFIDYCRLYQDPYISYGVDSQMIYINSTECGGPSYCPGYKYFYQGIIEFDISNLGFLTSGSFSAKLSLYGAPLNAGYNELEVYDLPENSEDGQLNYYTNRPENLIGPLFTNETAYWNDYHNYSIDVTTALENDLLVLNTNHFSGFYLNWKYIYLSGEEELPCVSTPEFSGPVSGTDAPKLIITTASPTLIILSSFTVESKKEKIILKWQTESEVDNLGFNILRSDAEDGEYVKINKKLIPTKGNATNGRKYKFRDKNVEPGKTYFYKLEDIDRDGKSILHGAVSVTVNFKKKK